MNDSIFLKKYKLKDTEIWINYFYSFLKSTNLPFLSIKVTNEFSEVIKKPRHKPMSLSDLKKLLKKLLKVTDMQILKELDDATDANVLYRLSYEAWQLLDNAQRKAINLDFVSQLIWESCVKHSFIFPVLGEYCDSERKITLFPKEFDNLGLYPPDIVYAHESFHGYHFQYARQNASSELYRADYITSVVLESLASYFENEYAKENHGFDITSNWNHSVFWYPYSGAKYIKSRDHLVRVFEASTESMEKAVDILFESYPNIAQFLKELSISLKEAFPRKYGKKDISMKPTTPKKPTISPIQAPCTFDKRKSELEEAYDAILTDLTDGSQKSYRTYLKMLFEDVLDDLAKSLQPERKLCFIDLFLYLPTNTRTKLLVIAKDYLEYVKKNGLYSCAKHTMSNRYSAFNRFFEVAIAYDERAVTCKEASLKSLLKLTEQTIISKYNSIGLYVYTKSVLDKIYMARLRTQDRYYKSIIFPMRLAMKLTAKRDALRKKLEKSMLERLSLLEYIISPDGTKSIMHKSIKRLELNIKKDLVTAGANIVYTYCNKSDTYKTQKPEISSISIDHKVSLNTLLGDNPLSYPGIKRVSDDMISFLRSLSETNLTASKKSTLFYDSIGKNYTDGVVSDFIDDMCILYSQMNFVAMDKSENSSKNDSI